MSHMIVIQEVTKSHWLSRNYIIVSLGIQVKDIFGGQGVLVTGHYQASKGL